MKPTLKDLARCRVLLKRRERKAGLEPERPHELAQDYFRPEFDDDPLAVEYRQLSRHFRSSDSAGEDPVDPPEKQRKPKLRWWQKPCR